MFVVSSAVLTISRCVSLDSRDRSLRPAQQPGVQTSSHFSYMSWSPAERDRAIAQLFPRGKDKSLAAHASLTTPPLTTQPSDVSTPPSSPGLNPDAGKPSMSEQDRGWAVQYAYLEKAEEDFSDDDEQTKTWKKIVSNNISRARSFKASPVPVRVDLAEASSPAPDPPTGDPVYGHPVYEHPVYGQPANEAVPLAASPLEVSSPQWKPTPDPQKNQPTPEPLNVQPTPDPSIWRDSQPAPAPQNSRPTPYPQESLSTPGARRMRWPTPSSQESKPTPAPQKTTSSGWSSIRRAALTKSSPTAVTYSRLPKGVVPPILRTSSSGSIRRRILLRRLGLLCLHPAALTAVVLVACIWLTMSCLPALTFAWHSPPPPPPPPLVSPSTALAVAHVGLTIGILYFLGVKAPSTVAPVRRQRAI